MTAPEHFRQDLQGTLFSRLKAIVEKGPNFVRYFAVRPALGAEIAEIESALGTPLPPTLSELFGRVAERLEFSWALEPAPSVELTTPIFLGNIHWSLPELPRIYHAKLQIETGADIESLWKDKFPLSRVGNDFLAVSVDETPKVYLLTADVIDPSDSVVEFKCDLFEFLLDWARIAGICEMSSIVHFCNAQARRIDRDNRNTVAWLSWLGVNWDEQL